jgi:hypothetical protein
MKKLPIYFLLLLALLLSGCSNNFNDVSNKDKSSNIIENKESCPEFDNCEFFGSETHIYLFPDTCDADLKDWKLAVNYGFVQTGSEEQGLINMPVGKERYYVYCRKGMNVGENVNHYYCPIYIKKDIVMDSQGNIIAKNLMKTIIAEYDVNSKKLIKQECSEGQSYFV